ncbi:MAG TPA: phosphoribosylanthranilate isomerase, partial [Burkholderiaceae bacterium]|nr:phosphoribosylanthranilate isomerase [Burkholderiaceae bacterium]
RVVSVEQARALRQTVPAFVSAVALFVDPTVEEVNRVIDQVRPDLLQFHGNETPEFCRRFAHRYIRAFRVGAPGLATPEGLLAQCRRYDDAAGWLFDSFSSGFGGSGRAFDVSLLRDVLACEQARPVILAGGLSAATLGTALDAVHPFAVDVSSGVEDSPGIKSDERVAAFIGGVREHDSLRRPT